ncbi:MAG: rhomboid family intramembrane serine protease [Myxococcota bacterium]
MGLSEVLAWIIGAECVLAIGMILRVHRLRFPGWLVVHGLVLAALVVGWLVAPGHAGWIAAVLWTPLVLAPILGRRAVTRLAGRQRFDAAAKVARITAWLHPMDGWREIPRVLEANARIAAGDRDGGRRILQALRDEDGPLSREATLQLCRMEGRWEELILLVDTHPKREALLRDPNVLPSYVRALGETGRVEEMLAVHAERVEPLAGSLGARWLTRARLVAAAFAGRVRLVESLLAHPGRDRTPDADAYWRATALQAAGRSEEARELLHPLAERGHPMVRPAAARRLDSPVRPVADEELPEAALEALRHVEGETRELLTYGSLTDPPVGPRPRATWALIVANVAVFVAELPGGAQDAANLFAMGALLAPADLLEGEWWRVVTSAFLHFGVGHLLMNMVALWFFGRYLERVLGTLRFAILYAIAAPASMALITLVATWRGTGTHLIVGASGGVMALLGAILAVLGLRWRLQRTPVAGRDLLLLLAMLGLQTAFDVLTPQVSFIGHAAGAILGLGLGLLLAPRRRG